ncbi:deoxynucleotidyltransferase terminal-interacting protein 2 [Colossoma macropomum]|uniref:deoxynucleotidyltransferase terminal-interacting protein 2 n=1 Tax=Colossoma macropomum TaxID=42526 RepID=UPI00186537BB|nr:deoxynucleotidyltransferase terminal-interacting protein 2 [Colossoma macropomum]
MLNVKMVATRRGTRVGSPVKNTDLVTEPSTSVRRTRRRVIVTNQSQSEQTSDSQQNDAEEQNTAPSEPPNLSKRETRRSKRHLTDANQPDSTHEADVSESESCCSVASGVLMQSTTRGRRRAPIRQRPTAAAQQEASEGESCSSPPASKPRRSMRSQKKPCVVPAESTSCKDDHSEAESCSSIASLSKVIDSRRITRSHRRTAVSPGGEDPSEADSCSSAVSGPHGSTVRRSMRNRRTKPTEPIPIHLEESEPTKALASSAPTRTRRGKSKVKSADENQDYDSEGCHSGPSTSPRKMGGVIVVDSDSESLATNYSTVDSPSSLKVRLTPCSSRTGSASSNRAVPVSRTRWKATVTHDASNATSVVSESEKLDSKDSELEKDQTETPMGTVSDREDIEEMDEEETSRTVISVDCQECSILENLTLTLDEDIISSSITEAKMVDSDCRQETSLVNDVTVSENTEHVEEKHSTTEQTPTEKDVKILEECKKISEPVMENEAESVLEVHGLGDQTGVLVMKPGKGVTVTEEDQPILVEQHDTKDQKRSYPARTEKSVMVVVRSEDKHEAVEEKTDLVAEDNAAVLNQKRFELVKKNIKVREGVESEAAMVLDVPQKVSDSLTVAYTDLSGQDVEDEQDMEVEQNIDVDASHHDTEDQRSLAPAQTEKNVMVVVGSEEKDEAVEEKTELVADDNAAVVDQKPSKLAEKSVKVIAGIDMSEAADVLDVPQVSASQTITVTYSDLAGQKVEDREVEQHTDMYAIHHESELQNNAEDGSAAETEQEGPSCSSKAQGHKTSVLQTKPEKRVLSLLDSSEDEESDSEGLSDEGCKEDAGDLESEDDAVRSDEVQPGSSNLFVIDARPGLQPNEKYYIDTTRHEEDDHLHDSKDVEDEEDFIDEEADDEDDEDSKTLFTTRRPALMELSSSIDPGLKMKELGGLYISFDGSKSKPVSNNLKKLKDQKNQDELLKNSVIVADFEKKDAVPPYKESKHAAKLKRKEEKAKTTGDGWFNMRAPELTEDLKNDLKALKMRSAMDPKRFYKKNDREGFPKYFQVGTVVDNPADFYHSRIPKKQRKRTIVEELLADAEFRSFNKRKYHEIMAEKAADAAGKINKKKHKFHKKK